MKREILILDTEICDFGIHHDHGGLECAARTLDVLLKRNAEIAKRVGFITVGTARMGRSDGRENGVAQSIAEQVGLAGVAGVDVHAYCASGNMAIREAVLTVEAGRADIAVAVGVEHLSQTGDRGPLQPEAGGPEVGVGFTPPVFYALCASRYLHETAAPLDAIAAVAVENRRHASSNVHARFRDPLTIPEVLASRAIASPLTLLQCCAPADGAGAAIVVGADVVSAVERSSGAVRILGLGVASGGDRTRASLTDFPEDAESGRQAFEEAGVAPEDVDVAEVHDAFTISQVIAIEDLGFRPRGEGWRHALEPTSRPAVNPGGGHLSRGHPLGATGIAQFDAVRRWLNRQESQKRRRIGVVSQAGGLRVLGQVVSTCAVMEAA